MNSFKLWYLSLCVPRLICGVNFYVCSRFSTPSLYCFWSRSPRIPQQPQSVFEGEVMKYKRDCSLLSLSVKMACIRISCDIWNWLVSPSYMLYIWNFWHSGDMSDGFISQCLYWSRDLITFLTVFSQTNLYRISVYMLITM